MINDPVFAGYGRFLFPIERQLPDDDMQISDMEALFRLHNNINITTAVNTLNAMRQMAENGDLEFYDIYTEDEKANDPAKEETGLFFFHGEANAPFAVINASGGFSYVASLHTAFPHAVDLNGRGYNAFPELQSQVDNLDQYDVVYLGLPVWAGQMPAPVTTFLTENDLSGKTIIPFNIHLGSGFGRIKGQIEELCSGATIMDAFTIRASTGNDDVRTDAGAWLDELGIGQS